MAHLPVEILWSNADVERRIKRAFETANTVQSEFFFAPCDEHLLTEVMTFASTGKLLTENLFDEMEVARHKSRGFHPFLSMFCDSYLIGSRLSNLFGDHRADKGLAIVTFHEVDQIVGSDDDSYTGYSLYYLARYCMSFVSPAIGNHDETRQCIFDLKVSKLDIISSIRAGALCDRCRTEIWKSGRGTTRQMDAVDKLIDRASSLIHKTTIARRANVFIGSSSKHLQHAHALKELLGAEFQVQVWNEDQVFRLGSATIEQLEEHVRYYDFGIFFMMPDDELRRGDRSHKVPRDNVVFEAGLFTGKLSRSRTIVLTMRDDLVTLPSDLNGLTTLRIDGGSVLSEDLKEAAERACSHMKYVFGQGQ